MLVIERRRRRRKRKQWTRNRHITRGTTCETLFVPQPSCRQLRVSSVTMTGISSLIHEEDRCEWERSKPILLLFRTSLTNYETIVAFSVIYGRWRVSSLTNKLTHFIESSFPSSFSELEGNSKDPSDREAPLEPEGWFGGGSWTRYNADAAELEYYKLNCVGVF